MESIEVKNIIQAVIQASKEMVTLEALYEVFKDDRGVETVQIQEAIESLLKENDLVQELKMVAGGYRYQIKQKYIPWVLKNQNEEIEAESLPVALREVLAIIAYKQPISRGEIEYLRGRQTSQSVFQQLEEREWIKVVAYGGESNRAMLYGTTLEFLAYFGLNSVEELPELPELSSLDQIAELV